MPPQKQWCEYIYLGHLILDWSSECFHVVPICLSSSKLINGVHKSYHFFLIIWILFHDVAFWSSKYVWNTHVQYWLFCSAVTGRSRIYGECEEKKNTCGENECGDLVRGEFCIYYTYRNKKRSSKVNGTTVEKTNSTWERFSNQNKWSRRASI